MHHEALIATQIGISPAVALATDVLGFFGGHSLGVSQAWLILPAVAISLWAMFACMDRRAPGDPVHVLLLILAAVLVMPLVGFAKPRSFLYLAPVMTCVIVLALQGLAVRRPKLAIAAAALVLAPSVAAIANIQGGTHPFKRNLAIPYASVLDTLRGSGNERVLLLSIDDVLAWLVAHRPGFDNVCASRIVLRPACAGKSYDRVVVVRGHSDLSTQAATMQRFERTAAEVTAGRTLAATIHAGVDKDAKLKTWLTGVPLNEAILTLSIYR